jgi:hypothetical protein
LAALGAFVALDVLLDDFAALVARFVLPLEFVLRFALFGFALFAFELFVLLVAWAIRALLPLGAKRRVPRLYAGKPLASRGFRRSDMDAKQSAATQTRKQKARATMLREGAKRKSAVNKMRAQYRSRQAQKKISMQSARAKQKAHLAKATRERAVQQARARARFASARAKQTSKRATARARARQAR